MYQKDWHRHVELCLHAFQEVTQGERREWRYNAKGWGSDVERAGRFVFAPTPLPLHHISAFWDEEKVPEGARNRRYIVDLNVHENPLDTAAEGEPVPLHFINLNKLRNVPVLAAVLHGRRAERMVRQPLILDLGPSAWCTLSLSCAFFVLQQESRETGEVVAQLCRSLRRLYPHIDEVPTPLSSHMTRWTSEENIMGATTHLPLGTEGYVSRVTRTLLSLLLRPTTA